MQVMQDDKAFYKFLAAIEEYGIFLMKSAPVCVDGAIRPLGNRVSFTLETCYGFVIIYSRIINVLLVIIIN